jgi:hypothetical protein
MRRELVGEGDDSLIEASEPRRSASLGASGIAGTVSSLKILLVCELYFWWNGEGMLSI